MSQFWRFFFPLILTGCLSGQVRINEFMASNTRALPDIVDFEDYPDWIELHNPNLEDASLDGFFLSDDPASPFKWPIPDGAVVPAGGYLLFMADGNDAGLGESHPRGYWPWRDFTTERYHTNFGLSAEGESVVLTRTSGATSTTLVTTGSRWAYLDDGSDQSTQWRARNFDDSGWASGLADFGYGDDPVTEVSYGGDEDNKYITTYFRHKFNVTDSSLYQNLSLALQADDGAVVYLNGAEIVRDNMPAGIISSLTTAVGSVGSSEADFLTYAVPVSGLVTGDNVLAVEIHQRSADSSDIRFDLSLEASFYTGVVTVDTISYGSQVTDISYGRDAESPTIWKQFAESTPGSANTTAEVTSLRFSSREVTIAPRAGFYSSDQIISLSTTEGEIYYTLDGSNPSTSATLYTESFPISATTIVRARVFEAGKVPGPILTSTYIYGESFNGLPIVSAVADPETLFGDEIGIYDNDHEPVRSRMNEVYKKKDAPGHIEFFPVDGSEGFQVNGGFRIGGENNWGSHEQKALNFTLRGKYGDDAIKYDLFPGSNIPVHTAIAFREGGDDWDDAMLRDAMWNTIAEGRLEAETNASRPCVVFLNGEYWGVYNIRSRWDEQWLFEHYGVDNGEYDHIGYGRFTSSSTTLGVENGDLEDWLELLEFIDANDINEAGNWAFVESRVDLDSFIDFIVSESFANNTSWGHNREMWKAHKPGSKWRWFLPDMDRTFKDSGINSNVFDDILKDDALLDRIKNQPTFKARLAQRYAAHIASTFSSARINKIIDSLGATITPELDRHKEKWDGSIDADDQARDLKEIKDYNEERLTEVHDEIDSELSIDSAVDIPLAANGSGSFRIEGVEVEAGTLKLFPNLNTTVEAVPAPGFAFVSWEALPGEATTILNFAGPATLAANFIPTGGIVTGGTLASDTTFTLANSPYFVASDLIVPAGTTLDIDPGVVLEMATGRNIRVMGTLDIKGTAGREVIIRGRSNTTWGGLSFEEPLTTSTLTHLIVRDASRGQEPTLYPAGIAGLNADVVIDFLNISGGRGPLFFRGGSTILRDSFVDIPITGDGINIKGGYAETHRTTFLGNNSVDTDAIDYDGVTNGIIKGCRIYNFRGFNSDGIDTGEQCVDILIEGNSIFYNSDKGISVGQGSTVIMRNNLVVGCLQGVGVKDAGSAILVDQNTFVDCAEAVASFEKNFGKGGGAAIITNSIFSKCGVPVSSDAFSTLTVSYSLSDTTPLVGPNNLIADPLFVDATDLNFQLLLESPAKDSGDPAHTLDPDATRADRGALYTYSSDDYPFEIGKTVVINEILANSGTAPDWIELYNRSSSPVNIGGWFLSDDGSDLAKYRIPLDTVLPANGYLTFFEDTNFGPESSDPNRITGFGLSDNGETVHLTSAINDVLTDYRFKENFGASLEGTTLGYYYKPGSGTYNFIALQDPTPAAPNAAPKIGPIIISEVMYNPAIDGASEYLELLNISDSSVSLFDNTTGKAWQFSDGIDYEFPAGSPLVMAPGERIVLTRSLTAFNSEFTTPEGIRVFEWLTGKLSGGGETVQLARPGPVNDLNEVQYVRVDRVKYNNKAPWPISPDGDGPSLTKIAENQYGNDYLNWRAAAGSPGAGAPGLSYDDWVISNNITSPSLDNDGDGLSNLIEYALGTDPAASDDQLPLNITLSPSAVIASYEVNTLRPDADLLLESSSDLVKWSPVKSPPVALSGDRQLYSVIQPITGIRFFYRLAVRLKP